MAENGRVLVQRALGWADRRFQVPMTMDTRLGIGSVTKSFTAAAILRLQTRRKLSISDPLARHLPGVPRDKAAITLAQLLSHTAGVRRDVPDIPDDSPRDALLQSVLREPLVDSIGGPFHYSNSGYDLLAAVVERVSGMRFDQFVSRELLAPAGMTASGVAGSPLLAAGPAARGYNEWKEVAAWTEWPAGWRGMGSGRMVATALDLWRWGESVQNGKALSAAEWQAMSTRHAMEEDSTHYGYGVHISDLSGGRTLLVMGGDVDGYRAELRLYPASRRIIVVLTNQDLFGLGVQRRVIANTLSRLAQGQDPPLPPAPAKRAARDPALGAYRLATGGTIELWEQDGRLQLGARGQDAVDLFEPPPRDSAAFARARTLSDSLMNAAAHGDSIVARRLLPGDQYAFAYPFLAKRLKVQEVLHDGLRAIVPLGVVSLPWDPGTLRSYYRMDYAEGSDDVFLGWQESRLNDITFGEGRPFAALYTVAPVANGGYASWDWVRSRATRFRVGEDGAELVVATGHGEVVARRRR